MIANTLQRICELQPLYSSDNSPAMKERGNLIRTTLVDDLKGIIGKANAPLGPFTGELGIEGSDGIGRKTEAPWTRIYSRRLSPTPREGYYVVLHFAADGSAMFVTVGCGSTIWANGELRPVSDADLQSKTQWARAVIAEAFGSLTPFDDAISLGARAKLPLTFEKATAVACRVPVHDITNSTIDTLLLRACAFLTAIYSAQLAGRDPEAAEALVAAVAQISRPVRAANEHRGFMLSALERRLVEKRAMRIAAAWLTRRGYDIEDVSATSSFDFLAKKGDIALKVEVKGTTSDKFEAILMTRNEVALHRSEKGKTALCLVSSIRLDRTSKPPNASGGRIEVLSGWDIDHWPQEAIAFQLRRPPKAP